MPVDPKVYTLAAAFAADLVRDEPRRRFAVTPELLSRVTERLSGALQWALEDELEAIRRELLP